MQGLDVKTQEGWGRSNRRSVADSLPPECRMHKQIRWMTSTLGLVWAKPPDTASPSPCLFPGLLIEESTKALREALASDLLLGTFGAIVSFGILCVCKVCRVQKKPLCTDIALVNVHPAPYLFHITGSQGLTTVVAFGSSLIIPELGHGRRQRLERCAARTAQLGASAGGCAKVSGWEIWIFQGL